MKTKDVLKILTKQRQLKIHTDEQVWGDNCKRSEIKAKIIKEDTAFISFQVFLSSRLTLKELRIENCRWYALSMFYKSHSYLSLNQEEKLGSMIKYYGKNTFIYLKLKQVRIIYFFYLPRTPDPNK